MPVASAACSHILITGNTSHRFIGAAQWARQPLGGLSAGEPVRNRDFGQRNGT